LKAFRLSLPVLIVGIAVLVGVTALLFGTRPVAYVPSAPADPIEEDEAPDVVDVDEPGNPTPDRPSTAAPLIEPLSEEVEERAAREKVDEGLDEIQVEFGEDGSIIVLGGSIEDREELSRYLKILEASAGQQQALAILAREYNRKTRPVVLELSRAQLRDALAEVGVELDAEGDVIEAEDMTPGILIGTVTDPDGLPLPGTTVTIGNTDIQRGGQALPGETTHTLPIVIDTDANGSFRVEQLPPIEYQVTATHDSYGSYYAASVQVPPASTESLFITLQSEFIVSGSVRDEFGQPVAGAEVHGIFRMEGAPNYETTALTRDDGSYTLPVKENMILTTVQASRLGYRSDTRTLIAEGSRDIDFGLTSIDSATVRGVVTDASTGTPLQGFRVNQRDVNEPSGYFEEFIDRRNTLVRIERDGFEPWEQNIKFADGETVDLGTINLSPLRVVTTTVWLETETGDSIRATDAQLTATLDGNPVDEITDGENGTFILLGIPAGELIVQAAAPGFASTSSTTTIPTDRFDPIELNLTLMAGRYTASLTITDNETGEPVVGSEVYRKEILQGLTDETGNLLVTGLIESRVIFQIRHWRYAEVLTPEVNLAENGTATDIHVAMEPLSGLGGRVLRQSAAVATGTVVHLWKAHSNETWETATAEDGGYYFVGVEPGDYFVFVPEYRTHPTPVTVTDKTFTSFDIAVAAVADIVGTLRYVDGRPASNVTIHLHHGDYEYHWNSGHFYSDENGEYRISRVPLGKNVLSIHKSDLDTSAQVTRVVQVGTAGEHREDIILPDLSNTITGRVVTPTGSPIAGLYVGAGFLEGDHREIISGWVKTNADGYFVMPRMRNGRHLVRTAWASDREAVVFAEELNLSGGETRDVTLTTAPRTGYYVTGTVRNTDGSPSSVAFCFATDSLGRESGNYFGGINWSAESTYNIGPLAPGSYTIRVTAQGCVPKDVQVTVGTEDVVQDLTMERHP
jgi:protocatechuate 3,4-dioxygenase beta subunit